VRLNYVRSQFLIGGRAASLELQTHEKRACARLTISAWCGPWACPDATVTKSGCKAMLWTSSEADKMTPVSRSMH
jgi:hypothetical protein